MEPTDTQNQPSLNLPKPAADNSAVPVNNAVPQTPNSVPVQPQPLNSTSLPAVNSQPAPLAPGSTLQQSVNPSIVAQDSPSVAEDSDLIEKEWVDKAKNIVEKTRNDPHLQNQKINQMKAEYIKKRYNKDIKLTNE